MVFFDKGDLFDLLIFISKWMYDKFIKMSCNMHVFEHTSTTDFGREQEHGGFAPAIKMYILLGWSAGGVYGRCKKWFEYSKQVVLQWLPILLMVYFLVDFLL